MLFIATPLYENKVTVQYMHGLLQTVATLQARGLSVEYAFEQGTYIAINREKLVRRFLETECQFFLFIDADTGFTPLDVLGLLSANVDVVSAMYRYRQEVPNGTPEHCFRGVKGEVIDTRDTAPDMQECRMVPTGMLMIRRQVFEELYRKHKFLFDQGFRANDDDEQKDPILAAFEGEDVCFSRLWREMGGQLFVKARVRVAHIGDATYRVVSKVDIPRNTP